MTARLRPTDIEPDPGCRLLTDPVAISDSYADYLGDASGLRASSVQTLALPRTVEQLAHAMRYHHERGQRVTFSGGRTGATAGACPPEGGHLVSLTQLSGVASLRTGDGRGPRVRVRAGTRLAELDEHLREHAPGLFFPVDPTEISASIGGMVSTDASGPRSLRYGSTRDWVRALRVVLGDGRELELRRRRVRASGEDGGPGALELEEPHGGIRRLEAAPIPKPRTKNSLGPCFAGGVDAVDVLVGAEGTLGAVAEVELALAPRPAHRLYYLQLLESDEQAFDLVEWLRGSEPGVLAIEHFDERSLQLAAAAPGASRNRYAAMVEPGLRAALYCEIELASEDELEAVYNRLEAALARIGASPERSGAGLEPSDLEQMKGFRHAVPEQINALLARRRRTQSGLHKVATDMAVGDADMRAIYRCYRDALAREGLEHAIFGHVGNNHFHVNVLPRDPRELERAKALCEELAREVAARGGAVSAEHGLGRIKQHLLHIQYGPEALESLARIQRFFDPDGQLNPGVLRAA